jgi:hypothetical protein
MVYQLIGCDIERELARKGPVPALTGHWAGEGEEEVLQRKGRQRLPGRS